MGSSDDSSTWNPNKSSSFDGWLCAFTGFASLSKEVCQSFSDFQKMIFITTDKNTYI